MSHGEFCAVLAAAWWSARTAQYFARKATLKCYIGTVSTREEGFSTRRFQLQSGAGASAVAS